MVGGGWLFLAGRLRVGGSFGRRMCGFGLGDREVRTGRGGKGRGGK